MMEYSDASIENHDAIHKLGEEIIEAFSAFIETDVHGVPPSGDWQPEKGDYHDAKFSDFDDKIFRIDPVSMGVAVYVPSYEENFGVWVKILVTMELEADEFIIVVADAPAFRISRRYELRDVKRICNRINQELLAMFTDPVRHVRALSAKKIGFRLQKQ